MQTNNKMAVAPVGKLIWQMSIPPLISTLPRMTPPASFVIVAVFPAGAAVILPGENP